jgi:hypothetical protein
MELFNRLFGNFLVFIYHCFDRIVINGYLSNLSRPEQVVHFYKNLVGEKCITKEALGKRTKEYTAWVESYAFNQGIPIEWAEKNVRKEDYVQEYLRRFKRRNTNGVYFIFKSMEQGPTFRSITPRFPTTDSTYRILKKHRSRYTHYYFYILDEVLGPMVMRVGTFLPFQTTYYLNGHNFMELELKKRGIRFRKEDNAFLSVSDPKALQSIANSLSPQLIQERLAYWTFVLGPKFSQRERKAMNLNRFFAITQIEYCRNFVFRRNFPIRKLFERSCELGLWRLTVDKISHIFGMRITKALKGKLHTTLEKLEHGRHTLRAYWKSSFVKQYEKFRTFLRQEVCSNNLKDFRFKKGLDNLPKVREEFSAITERFTGLQAQALNVHVDFPLFQRIALPITVGTTKLAGIKIQDTRMIRVMEIMLHIGTQLSGWSMDRIYRAIQERYGLDPKSYTITQLRYDMRKMKAHGLVQRHGKQYRYLLTEKGVKVSLMFLFFHKRVCGPLANSLFQHQPNVSFQPESRLEKAYHKADANIQKIIDLCHAA